MKLIILSPIAEREVNYYLEGALLLRKNRPDIKVIFYSFYQPGNKLIRDSGFEVYDPYEVSNVAGSAESEKIFRTISAKDLILHEKLTFGLQDDNVTLEKFKRMVAICKVQLDEIVKKHPEIPARDIIVIQELGGFVAPLSLFYTAMSLGWRHYFLEPSFFNGRLFFDLNSLFCQVPSGEVPESLRVGIKTEVLNYLDRVYVNKTLVAPQKDSHHYMDMKLTKIFNKANAKKLFKKIYYKYGRGETQEYEHIWNHVRRYFRMYLNRRQNEENYSEMSDIPAGKKILYFPFHVQLDFALTIRSPDYLDQLGLVQKILTHLPADYVLVTKEHPASIGCLDQERLTKLIDNPAYFLLHPKVNTYDVLKVCNGVVTINSKVGA
ncbi:MAG: capsular polysaccharide export protein, LipB/KpsS family, partial [Pseudobdellovibrio sp.]